MTAGGVSLTLVRVLAAALGLVGSAAVLVSGATHDKITDALSVALPVLAFAAVGLLVSARMPRNAIGWLFLGVAAAAGLIGIGNSLMEHAVDTGQLRSAYAMTAAWAANFLWVVVIALGFSLPLLLFPYGLPGPRWRPVIVVTVASTVLVVLLGMLSPTLTFPGDGGEVANPIHRDSWSPAFRWLWGAAVGALCLCSLAALGSAVMRYRRARGVERAQMRWLAFSGAIVVLILFLPGINSNNLAFGFGFCLVPVSCGVAILRYRLYEIDRIISRTTSYALVTALVLATYALVVTVVLRVLPDSSSLAVATATLAAAAIARPAVRRIQRIVDRRFDRIRYDQIRTIETFGEQVRHVVDPEDVCAQLVSTVAGTLQPATAVLWSGGGTSGRS